MKRLPRCAMLLCCALPLAVRAQDPPLDNAFEDRFQSLDSRVFVDDLPPRVELAEQPPELTALLPQAPRFTEQRETVIQLNFDGTSLEANQHRLLTIQPEQLSLVPDGQGGLALRLVNEDASLVGVTRPLDPNRLAGRLVELSARVRLPRPYRLPPDAPSWARPIIQLRWERPHPEPAARRQGEIVREWHSIFERPRGRAEPADFVADDRYHTYRTRLAVPADLTGAMLQIVVQNCFAEVFVDDVAVSLVTTREERLLTASAERRTGNLLGPGADFELGLTRGAVVAERRLSPLAGGPLGRDFGRWRLDEGSAAEGRRSLALLPEPNLATTLEWPWCGLAAGQPYTLSLWLRAGREGVPVAFGVTDAEWRVLGTRVVVGTTWRRYAATFTPPTATLQAFWPWITVEPRAEAVEVQLDGLQLETGGEPGEARASGRLQLDLDTGRGVTAGVGHLFADSEPVAVTARLLQRSPVARTVRLKAVLESHLGRAFRTVACPESLDLPAGGVVELPLLGEPLPRGLYRLWLTATDPVSGEVARAERLFAVLPATVTPRFGFHDGPGRPDRTTAVAAGALRVGAALLRTGGSPVADWREHWLGDGRHDWSLFDSYLAGWNDAGVRAVLTLGPFVDRWPAWVIDRYGGQFGETARGERLLPPDKLWAAYVRDVVDRARDRVAAVEVLWQPEHRLTAAEYLPLLRTAATVIRETVPGTPVVGPSIERTAAAEPGGFIDELLAAGGAEWLDVLSVQLDAAWPEQLDRARDNLRAAASRHGLRLWDMGHGYPEAPLATDRLNPRARLERWRAPFSPQPYDGAAFVARHELLLAAAGFERSFQSSSIAELEYLHAPVGPLIEADGAPRSGLVALAVLAAEVGAAPPAGEWRWEFTSPAERALGLPRHGARAVAFRTGEDRVWLAWWTFQRDATLTVPCPATPGRLLLADGAPVRLPADGRLRLTHWPLYLADLPPAALAELDRLELGGVRPEVIAAP